MSTLLKRLFWVGANGLMVLSALGAFLGFSCGANLLLFIAWANFIITIVSYRDSAIRNEVYRMGPSVSLALNAAFDICFVLVMAAAGWFVTATIMFLTWAMQHTILTVPLVDQEEDEEND
jgi:hypothetical protein